MGGATSMPAAVPGVASGAVPGAARRSTSLRSAAARRPQSNALRFVSTATPLISTARSMAALDRGMWPFCHAWPSMNRLVAMASPVSAVASRVASTRSTCRAPAARSMPRISASAGKTRSALRVKSPVIVSWVFTTTAVCPVRIVARVSAPAVTTASQPSTRSAAPLAIRVVVMSPGRAAIRTWLTTAPPFCASPVWSSTEHPFDSRWAAIPSSAPMVMTPVPPTPVTMIS